MIWWNGYLVTTDKDDDRFYVYEIDAITHYISSISDSVSSNVQGIGKRNDRIYLADRDNDGVDVWDIDYTEATDGTTTTTPGETTGTISLSQSGTVSAVSIDVEITHPDESQLTIKLTSPTAQKSRCATRLARAPTSPRPSRRPTLTANPYRATGKSK